MNGRKGTQQQYRAVDDRKIRQSTRIAAMVFGSFLAVFGIFLRSFYSPLIGIMIIGAVILRKETFVNREGIVIIYDAVFFRHREVWPFQEMIEIHAEPAPNQDYIGLHFTKQSLMAKRVTFTEEDADAVIALAKEMNPEIQIS